MDGQLWLLKSLDRVTHALRRRENFDALASDALEAAQLLFDGDRAFLARLPIGTDTGTIVERTAGSTPSVAATALSAAIRSVAPMLEERDVPVSFGPSSRHPATLEVAAVNAGAMLAVSIHPLGGERWVFGVQRCSAERAWTAEEQQLMREMARHLCDALS